MNRARLARYSIWQFRDFVIEKGFAILFIGALLGYFQLLPFRLTGVSLSPEAINGIVVSLGKTLILFWVFIVLNGIISTDRKLGYYRFIFAHPVTPARYYAQLFIVNLGGLLAGLLLLSGVFFIFAGRFNVWNLVLYALLFYISMGGIGFFLSAVTKHDWVALAAVWLGSSVLRGLFGNAQDWRSVAVQVLPPVHRMDSVARSLIVDGTAPGGDLVWLVGYGALFFVLGLIVLQRRPLAA
jgi:hypothetical protein